MDSTANNAHPSANASSTTPGEHILSCRDERHGHQNHGGNQSSRHGQSNDQPDPALGCQLRAAGLLEVAVPGCCGHDRLTLNNEPGATETVASVHKVLGASTVRRPDSEVLRESNFSWAAAIVAIAITAGVDFG